MRKGLVLLLGIFFGLLPFHAFLKTTLNLPFFLASWKEIIVLILCCFSAFLWIRNKNRSSLDLLDLTIVAFVLWALATGIIWTGDVRGDFFPDNLFQVLFGAKYTLFFLLVFFALRHLSFSSREKEWIVLVLLSSASISLVFGILQKSVLPEEFLTTVGYSETYGKVEVSDGDLSYCHKIENSLTHEEFCRIQSTFSGPNAFGAFLLFVLPLLFYEGIRASFWPRIFFSILFVFGSLDLILSFSRSAWIGAMVATIFFFFRTSPSPRQTLVLFGCFLAGIVSLFSPILMIGAWDALKPLSLSGAMASLALLIFFTVFFFRFPKNALAFGVGALFSLVLGLLIVARAFFDQFFWNILYRPSSSFGHWERTTEGFSALLTNPFGLGLGDAGPASARFALPGQTGFLPENWYLQIGLETGFFGLLLFLLILFLTGRALFLEKSRFASPLFLGLVGISTAALFLHTWEDASLALSFWALSGIILAKEKEEESSPPKRSTHFLHNPFRFFFRNHETHTRS